MRGSCLFINKLLASQAKRVYIYIYSKGFKLDHKNVYINIYIYDPTPIRASITAPFDVQVPVLGAVWLQGL